MHSEWKCSRCTLLNDQQEMRCVACGVIRPRHANQTKKKYTRSSPSPKKKRKTNHSGAVCADCAIYKSDVSAKVSHSNCHLTFDASFEKPYFTALLEKLDAEHRRGALIF